MELGRISVRGQNVNLLWQAVHPQHGVVWSNGKVILLEKVDIHDQQVENNTPLKLGEFEHPVKSVHWSGNIGPNTCYLCVVHSHHVSVWKVEGYVPKLNFKQVRKLNVQPIPQGCLWNPGRDILCVIDKQQCSFFFHHTQNKGSFAFPPLESGTIKCGTWNNNGDKLVLCIGAELLVHSWPEIDMSVSNFSSMKLRIPSLQGPVSSIVTLSNDIVCCASELPLENLCKVKDSFLVPEIDDNTNSLQGEDIISPKKSGSITETLLNLQRNPQLDITSSTQLLTVNITEGQEPCQLSLTEVKGVLSPEVLLFMPHLKSVVVGSNSQNILQVFTFQNGDLASELIKTAEIKLDKQERPKGISNVLSLPNQNGVLITVGKRASSDSAFLTSSSGSAMEIKLKFFPFSIDESILITKNGTVSSDEQQEITSGDNQENNTLVRNPSCSLDKSSPTQTGEVIDRETHGDESDGKQTIYNRDLRITKQETVTELKDYSDTDSTNSSPRDIVIESQTTGSKPVIEDLTESGNSESELETETTDFSENSPHFKNDLGKYFHDSISNQVVSTDDDKSDSKDKPIEISNLQSSLDDSAVSMATSGVSMTTAIPDSTNLERMQLEIDKLNHRIEELKLKVGHLTNLIQESTIVTKYQSPSHPELIQIECQCQEMESRTKFFLLDNGRLNYEAVKTAFDLSTLEIFIDDVPCVASSNIDGYIPIRFTPSTTLKITGKAKRGDTLSVV